MALKSVTDTRMTPGRKTVQYAYDAHGRLQTTSYANGARQEYAYDAEDRLANLAVRSSAGAVLDHQALSYTPGGLLTGICASAHTAFFGYDVLNQISNETYQMAGGTNAARVYHYDANGNRTREDRAQGAASVSRFYDPAMPDDRITSHTENGVTTAYEYDACGNRLRRTSGGQGPTSFSYDAFGRMTAVFNSSLLARYTYDALGRKVARRTTDTDPHYDQFYIYDGLDPVCIVDDHWGPGPQVTWLLRGHGVAPGIGSIAAQQVTHPTLDGGDGVSTLHYYHPNHRGDTVFLTDTDGQQAAAFVYDAFGRLLSSANAHLAAYRFSGKEWDAQAGLYSFGFRWYDPDTGTWTTKDPLGFGGLDENVYRMVYNNPLLFAEWYGLWSWSELDKKTTQYADVGKKLGAVAGAAIGAYAGGIAAAAATQGSGAEQGAIIGAAKGAALGTAGGYVLGIIVGAFVYTAEEVACHAANNPVPPPLPSQSVYPPSVLGVYVGYPQYNSPNYPYDSRTYH